MQAELSGTRTANQARIQGLCANASGLDLLLLPELHAGPYPGIELAATQQATAETVPGPTSDFLSMLARTLQAVVVGSVYEQAQPGYGYNTALVFERDGQLVGRYRKTHIPHDPGFEEKYYFRPGAGPLTPVKTSAGQLGVLVCWDQWFPEAARCQALAGAELLLYPTAIGRLATESEADGAEQCERWQLVQRSHAICNGLPLLCANRWGTETSTQRVLHFWGQSFIAGQRGELKQVAPAAEDQLLVETLDLSETATVRQQWPFLRDRRPDLYAALNDPHH